VNAFIVNAHPEPKSRLLGIENAPKLFFHPAGDHCPNERLRPGVIARSGFRRNV